MEAVKGAGAGNVVVNARVETAWLPPPSEKAILSGTKNITAEALNGDPILVDGDQGTICVDDKCVTCGAKHVVRPGQRPTFWEATVKS